MNRAGWAALLFVAGCSSRSTDAAVYSAVIDELSSGETKGRTVQVEPATRFSTMNFAGRLSAPGQDPWMPALWEMKRLVPEASADVLDGFKAENLQPVQLKGRFADRSDVVLGNLGEFLQAGPSTMWGRITLSGIGFNSTRTIALVFAHVCKSDKTGGEYVLVLEYVEGAWRVRSCLCITAFAV